MKSCWILALLCSSIPALALSGGMEKAVVHAMRKVPCTQGQSGAGHGVLAEIVGSGPAGGECIEYVLRTAKVSYVIRPRRAILLLLDSDVTIKLANDELLLRTSEAPKSIRCAVVAMSLRSAEKDAEEDREAEKPRSQPAICLSESGAEVACSTEPEPFR